MANRISILIALEGADEGLKRAITNAERSLGGLSSSAKTASDKAAAGMAEVKAGVSGASATKSARLNLATAGSREYTVAQKDIAQRIGVPIQETATLYGRLQQAVRMLGGEQ